MSVDWQSVSDAVQFLGACAGVFALAVLAGFTLAGVL